MRCRDAESPCPAGGLSHVSKGASCYGTQVPRSNILISTNVLVCAAHLHPVNGTRPDHLISPKRPNAIHHARY